MIDLVFLSNAKTPELESLTKQAIKTALETTRIRLNIIVLERAGKIYNSYTIQMREPFSYNHFANFGASFGEAEWIMISNTDVIFKENWAEELLKAGYPIVSPYEPTDWRMNGVKDRETGYKIGRHLAGWCFMIKRTLWERIGHFDETFTFYFSDDIIAKQLEKINTPPMLVKTAVVEHLGSQTLESLKDETETMKYPDTKKWNKMFNDNRFMNNRRYRLWLKQNP